MKKFYATALAALCVVGASAGINGAQLRSDVVKKTVTESAVKATKTMAPVSFQKAAPDKIMSRAGETDSVYSIEGLYYIGIGDYYFQGGAGSIVEVAEIQREGDQILIECDYFMTDVLATYDEETGAISFAKIPFGEVQLTDGSVYYLRFEPFYYDPAKEDIVFANWDATFDSATGMIEFPEEHGFGWIAYEDSRYKMFKGYFDLFDVEGMMPYFEINDDEGWTSIGDATLIDAWITPSYMWNDGSQVLPEECPITAELQQNDETPTLYRLVNPYYDENWPLVGQNQSSRTGYIVFDIADPDHVVVKAGYPAGFKNSNGDFYVYGMLGWQIYQYGNAYVEEEDLPGIIEFMEEKGQPFDTYANGVVSVNKSVFDIAATCTKAYTWKDNEYIVSTITFPKTTGIVEIESNDNAPVEYFNLQGVRVDNPAAGQFVIKRQGTNVSKTIIR